MTREADAMSTSLRDILTRSVFVSMPRVPHATREHVSVWQILTSK